MNAPSPDEKRMWREARHVQMQMLLRCLVNGQPVPVGLRERTYTPEEIKCMKDVRDKYQSHLNSLSSPAKYPPSAMSEYVERGRKNAEALDRLRKQLRHLNQRVDLDDSLKRQKRPGIVRRYAELRKEFSSWLRPLEKQYAFAETVQEYLCKPGPEEPDYQRGKQYPWYYRFISVTEHNKVKSVDEYMVSAEIYVLRLLLAGGIKTE